MGHSPLTFSVTGVILAGGRGRAWAESTKACCHSEAAPWWNGCWTGSSPQVAEVLISANRNLERYLALGHPVLADRIAGFRRAAGRPAGGSVPGALAIW